MGKAKYNYYYYYYYCVGDIISGCKFINFLQPTVVEIENDSRFLMSVVDCKTYETIKYRLFLTRFPKNRFGTD